MPILRWRKACEIIVRSIKSGTHLRAVGGRPVFCRHYSLTRQSQVGTRKRTCVRIHFIQRRKHGFFCEMWGMMMARLLRARVSQADAIAAQLAAQLRIVRDE